MGTRADFYVRQGSMKWLGSKAYNGYPDEIPEKVLKAGTAEEFEAETEAFLRTQDDATFPAEGWPWPWNDSCRTDYAYIFEHGKVMASCFGRKLFDPLKYEEEGWEEDEDVEEYYKKIEGYFPDMSAIKNVKLGGNGSGLMVINARKDGTEVIKKATE